MHVVWEGLELRASWAYSFRAGATGLSDACMQMMVLKCVEHG